MSGRLQRSATAVLLGATATALSALACNGRGLPGDTPPAAAWIDDAGLFEKGSGHVVFKARDGNKLTALVYRGHSFDPATGPIWFVMHGASRDAERYIRAAAPVAERYDALAIVPHFTKQAYPESTDYTFGVTRAGLGSASTERWRDPDDYLYAEIEHLFDATRASLGGSQRGYYLFGHSAGAQFIHRLLTFLPGARAIGAVAANAGWYTLPSDRNPRVESVPYGLKGSPVRPQDLRGFFGMPFVVMLGDRDTTTAETDELVRGTREAQAQGATRIARGRFYFGLAESTAKEINADFAWRLAIAPRVGHDAGRLIGSAGYYLFAPGEPPCAGSTADQGQGLVITGVLADPPPGSAGDANGDGRRDPSEDEFVEIVNAGTTPVCLSGWALGDAVEAERHVFPLGRALPPGGRLVVFGGGVPTGRFDGAEIQWAAEGLNLSNAGDVVILRDGADSVVRRFSWGDCDGTPCAPDHWPGGLDIAGSLARGPEPGSKWHGPGGDRR